MISIQLIAIIKADEALLKIFDLRILALVYHRNGKTDQIPAVLDRIPEFYFTKMECVAQLTTGKQSFDAARFQMNLSGRSLTDMLRIMAAHYSAQGDAPSAALCRCLSDGVRALFREAGGKRFEIPGYAWIDQ